MERSEREVVREEFELISANLKTVLSKKPEQINFYERELLMSVLKKVIFIKESFDSRSSRFLELALSMRLESHHSNEVVFRKGDKGEFFYVVLEGVYAVDNEFSKDRKKEQNIFYYPGDSFGEVSLIYDVPRGATIVAHKDSTLIKVPKAIFNECGELEKSISYLNAFFEGHSFFQKEEKFMIRIMSSLSKLVRFSEEQVLVQEGYVFNEILFFAKGEVNVYKRLQLEKHGVYFEETILVATLCEGDVFGEKFYLTKHPATVRLVSKHPGEFIRVSFKDNVNTIDTPLYKRLRQNANRYPTDHEYFEQYKIYLQQKAKQLDYLDRLYRNDPKVKQELRDVKLRIARVTDSHLAN